MCTFSHFTYCTPWLNDHFCFHAGIWHQHHRNNTYHQNYNSWECQAVVAIYQPGLISGTTNICQVSGTICIAKPWYCSSSCKKINMQLQWLIIETLYSLLSCNFVSFISVHYWLLVVAMATIKFQWCSPGGFNLAGASPLFWTQGLCFSIYLMNMHRKMLKFGARGGSHYWVYIILLL